MVFHIVFVIGEYTDIFREGLNFLLVEFIVGKIFHGEESYRVVDFQGKFHTGGFSRISRRNLFLSYFLFLFVLLSLCRFNFTCGDVMGIVWVEHFYRVGIV